MTEKEVKQIRDRQRGFPKRCRASVHKLWSLNNEAERIGMKDTIPDFIATLLNNPKVLAYIQEDHL